MSDDDKTVDNKLLYCSFCGKSQQDVKKLIENSFKSSFLNEENKKDWLNKIN